MIIRAALILLVGLLSCSLAHAQRADTPGKHVTLFGLEGQSNMVGPGDPLSRNITSHAPDYTFIFTLGNKWFSPAFDPAHSTEAIYGGTAYPAVWGTRPRRTGHSPAIAFLNVWAKLHPKKVIGIVPNALSGTPLTDHLPGTPLFDAVNDRYKKAMKRGSIAAILFLQGESDARSQADAEAWADRFETIITARRRAIGHMPVVLVILGRNPESPFHPYWDTVKRQQKLAGERVRDVILVRAAGLEMRDDGFHIDDDAIDRLGEAMALSLNAYAD